MNETRPARALQTIEPLWITLAIVALVFSGIAALQRIRPVVEWVEDRGLSWRDLTLASNGQTAYRVTGNTGIVGLLDRGRALFMIAVGPLVEEVEAELAKLPSEPAGRPQRNASPSGW